MVNSSKKKAYKSFLCDGVMRVYSLRVYFFSASLKRRWSVVGKIVKNHNPRYYIKLPIGKYNTTAMISYL